LIGVLTVKTILPVAKVAVTDDFRALQVLLVYVIFKCSSSSASTQTLLVLSEK